MPSMTTSWWRRRQPGRIRLLTVGCTFIVVAFVTPLIVGLFTHSDAMIGSGGWWGWLTMGVAVVVFALVLIARFGWRDA